MEQDGTLNLPKFEKIHQLEKVSTLFHERQQRTRVTAARFREELGVELVARCFSSAWTGVLRAPPNRLSACSYLCHLALQCADTSQLLQTRLTVSSLEVTTSL